LEVVGPDGVVGVHDVGGRAAVAEYAPRLIGLTLEEGKNLLAALQVHLVQAQAEDHCRHRRRCQRCGAQRPLKDQRSRRLVSLFGTVEVRAPRISPCRCAATSRRTHNPVAEIMPDRCTPEYERVVAKMGSLLPPIAGRGRCWRSFCHLANRRPWKPLDNEPFVLALGPVDKPCPDSDASEQDESHEAGGELVISGGDAPLLLEMANEALDA